MDLKQLSLQELMDIEVTSVSRKTEELSTTPSAIQVITAEDIRRSGASSLPEALRLAPNLQVAQVTSYGWAITSRGFNGSPIATGSLANKLLVMIDGRTVYTPLYGGVFWDAQHVLLEDIDRIEVISGPGGTLWGANAVNGVINIITKKASETPGLYLSGTAGTFLKNQEEARYGGSWEDKLFYRAYARHFDRGHTGFKDSTAFNDLWGMTQGGFRLDYLPSDKDKLTLQGDLYKVVEGDSTTSRLNGQNILGTWSHTISERSNLQVKAYFDRTWRHILTSNFKDELNTFDIDIQHDISIGNNHHLIYGIGYRLSNDQTNSLFDPRTREMPIYSAFVQDQFNLLDGLLKFTLGVKLEHNVYVGPQLLPSSRVCWSITKNNIVWGAYSRAVRSPTRFDMDLESVPNRDFVSEKVNAYELGYRLRTREGLFVSLSGYFNKYNDLRSINTVESPPPNFIFANDQQAKSWGVEILANYRVSNQWRLKGGYTLHDKQITSVSTSVSEISDEIEAVDPKSQFLLHSILNLHKNIKFDMVSRYIGELEAANSVPKVPAYFTFDTRIAWSLKDFELSVVGQNLWQSKHIEFAVLQVPRTIYVTIEWRLNKI